VGEGGQRALQLAHVFAIEHARVSRQHARYAALAQGQLHCRGLLVGATQDGDVRCRQRAKARPVVHGGVVGQHRRDVAGDVARDLAQQRVGVVVGDLDQRQVEGCVLVPRAQARAAVVGGAHLLIGDVWQQERLRHAAVHGVEGLDQRRVGAPVDVERVHALASLATRAQVSGHVGATKAVDGLLGVADQQQRRTAACEDAPEDAVLRGVGVLELVDQRRAVLFAQALGQQRARGTA